MKNYYKIMEKYQKGGRFNTRLNKEQLNSFNKHSESFPSLIRDKGDYDTQGFYKSLYKQHNGNFDEITKSLTPGSETAHVGNDRFKKPNHPTFSKESKYHIPLLRNAGSWDGDYFNASRRNIKNMNKSYGSPMEYMQWAEDYDQNGIPDVGLKHKGKVLIEPENKYQEGGKLDELNKSAQLSKDYLIKMANSPLFKERYAASTNRNINDISDKEINDYRKIVINNINSARQGDVNDEFVRVNPDYEGWYTPDDSAKRQISDEVKRQSFIEKMGGQKAVDNFKKAEEFYINNMYNYPQIMTDAVLPIFSDISGNITPRIYDDHKVYVKNNVLNQPVLDHEYSHASTRGTEDLKFKATPFIMEEDVIEDPRYKNYKEGRDYYHEPTEQKARIDTIRKWMKENNLYDPVNEKFEQKHLDILKNQKDKFNRTNNLKYKGNIYDQMEDIIIPYKDEEIIRMFNTFTKNDDKDNKMYAKKGGLIKAQNGRRLVTGEHVSEPAEVIGESPEWLKQKRSREQYNWGDYKQYEDRSIPSLQSQRHKNTYFKPINDNLYWNIGEALEPSGVMSHQDVRDVWNDGVFDYNDIVEPITAVPILGRVPKLIKVGLKTISADDSAKDIQRSIKEGNYKSGGNIPCKKCNCVHKSHQMCYGGMVDEFKLIDEQDILPENHSDRFATKENNKPIGFKYSVMKINRY